jgi:hypothetical protein
VQVTIQHSQCYFHEVPKCRSFHGIHAIDADSLRFRDEAYQAWKTMDNATRCVHEKGIIIASTGNKNYFFDSIRKQWEIPKLFEGYHLPESPRTDLNYGSIHPENFWVTTFYHLASLAHLKAKVIQVEFLEENDKARLKLEDIQKLSQKILFPHFETEIHLSFQPELYEGRYDIFYLTNKMIDQPTLEKYIPLVKKNGEFWLDLHGWESEMPNKTLQDLISKTIAIFKYRDLLPQISEHAKVFAAAHHINLSFDEPLGQSMRIVAKDQSFKPC